MQSRIRGGSCFVGREAYTILGATFKKTNTKLGTKSEYLFRVLPDSWKGPVQMRGPESEASLA
jgi:hypothetical protein